MKPSLGRATAIDARTNEHFIGRGTAEADTAIQDARTGKIEVARMLQLVLEAQAFVPLDGEPSLEANEVKAWKPATVTKSADGSSFVVAFTNRPMAAAFCRANPVFSNGLLIECTWLIEALPPGHGILFNPGGASAFEWSAGGIRAFRPRES